MADLRHVALLLLVTAQVCLGKEPVLTILPDSIMKAVGQGVYVSCMADVDDTELVTEMSWTAPDGRRITNSVDDTVTTSEDGTEAKLDLIISKLREQDVGEYTCSATYAGNQNLEAKINVESFLEIGFGDTPTHQTLLIGQEGTVKCTPKARPAPQVDWYKNNVPIINDDNHIIRQDGIHIQQVTEADEGTYRCRARVLELGSIKQVNIQVEVYIPPVIDRPPQDLKGKETESIKFECGATGKPAPSYTWVDGENRPLDGLDGFHVDKETGDLTILDLKPERSGEYRCTATNSAGEDTKMAMLQVLTKPRVEEYLNLTMPVGSEVEMRCVVTGSPEPLVVFKKESEPDSFVDGINADDRISVSQETDDQGRPVGILKIRDVARSDDGLYTCTAQSEGGVTQRWGHITVEFKPTFEEQGPTVQWSWEKAPVNLTCLATSIPNATIQWYLRGQEIEYKDPNLARVKLGPQGVLRVNPVSSSYFGTYTCEATNTLGTASLDLVLKEAHPPGPINSAKVEKKTATTLTWSLVDPADDGGLPIQNYIVEYRENGQSWDNAFRKKWTKGSSYTIDNLMPQMTYVFRFAAQSKAGDGEWGGEKSEEMPRHAEPEEPMIFDATEEVLVIPYPSHYDLQWQVPLDNGKEIDHFQIVYYQVEEKAGKWEVIGDKTTREVKYPGTSSYKIEGLTANSHYKIELRAHNDIGYSTPAEAIIKTGNDPSVPTGSGSGPSVPFSSVAPSTTALAHDPHPAVPMSQDGLGTGIIVAIIIVVLVVVLVVLDASCFFTRNAGLIATIAGKRGHKDKDGKEAMLEDGKNASEDIQEGNGQMKTQKEDPDDLKKPEPEEDTNKKVESTEPSETTPMIKRRPLASPDMPWQQAVLTRRAASQDSLRDTPEDIQLQPRSNRPTKPPPRIPPRPKSARPVVVDVLRKGEDKGDPHPIRGVRPERGVSSNVRNLALISKSSPELDQFFDDLSSYDDSLYAKVTNGDDLSASSRGATPLPPPLPLRNSASQDLLLSQSQEMLSAVRPSGSRDELIALGLAPASSRGGDLPGPAPRTVKDSRGSKDAPGSGREEPSQTARPQRHPRNMDARAPPRTLSHDPPSAFPVAMAKEMSTQAAPRSGHRPGSREPFHAGNAESNSLRKSSEELNGELGTRPSVFSNTEMLQNLSRVVQASMNSGRPRKTPSISSNSTLYQPADTAHQHYPTQTAFKIAPYATPGSPAAPLPSPGSPHASWSPEMQPPKTRSNNHAMPSTATHRSERPGVPAPRHAVPRLTAQGVEEKGLQRVTNLHFRDFLQQPSHSLSMDHLDGPMDGEYPPGAQQPLERRPPPIPTAKSLSSLLDSSSSSLRAYGQPTLL
ncbi:fasciclin-2-like isoform X4 [Eriocheir sinensis]|uniref:fasciclin-2-like isoform X4 n=1 Tax=Eriocheir sinensis TaxID=95602 RepID=UPI0021C9A6BD|nr:fasciclin-2-like isoform X4 [Eriocheir sinensis]